MPPPYKVLSRSPDVAPPPAPEGSGSIPASGSGAGDWPEDFAGENGNYRCECTYCKQPFVGHKRRMVCKACFNESRRKFQALPRAEQERLLTEMRLAAEEFMAKRLNEPS